jgi:hypothetical protein
LERLLDNVTVIQRHVKRHGDCPPGRRARDRTDKMEETISMMTTVQSAVRSGTTILQKKSITAVPK